MKAGIVFDIKRYAIHDGPGIRTTVFLKGCQLRCWWCHNPEGINENRELVFQESRCLDGCDECIKVCPGEAVSGTGKSIAIDREKCGLSGNCADVCPAEALKIIGMEMTAGEVIREIEKDRIFFDNSKGGVTFSGGEPLIQIDFLNELLDECGKRSIHTVVDTCGYTPFECLDRIRDRVDLFLYDLKMMDDDKHREVTGVSNRIIMENLIKLSEKKSHIQVRIPVITGVNDSIDNLVQIAEFLKSLRNIEGISLLPFHKIGSQKYKNLDMPFKGAEVQSPSAGKIAQFKIRLEKYGFNVSVGG